MTEIDLQYNEFVVKPQVEAALKAKFPNGSFKVSVVDSKTIRINETDVHVDNGFVSVEGHNSENYLFLDRCTGYVILIVKGKFNLRCDYMVKPKLA